jgi:hypothetical protein
MEEKNEVSREVKGPVGSLDLQNIIISYCFPPKNVANLLAEISNSSQFHPIRIHLNQIIEDVDQRIELEWEDGGLFCNSVRFRHDELPGLSSLTFDKFGNPIQYKHLQ